MFKRQDQIKLQDKLQESISQRLKVEASRTRRIIHFWLCDKSNGRLIMRKFVFATGCVLMTAIGISAALAADIAPRARQAPREPLYVAYNWTGAYIGLNGGGGWGNSNFSAPFSSNSIRTSGGLIGGTLGYNWQAGQMVYGLEGDIDWTNLRGSGACALTSCEARNSWLGTARGRLGYAMDRVMPYVTGGLAVGDIRTSVAGVGSASSTKAGWTLGGGIEAAISGPVTAKVEYLYVDLGRGGSVLGSDASFHTNILRAGINYRF
jgi:outer membrane immunogenic protein